METNERLTRIEVILENLLAQSKDFKNELIDMRKNFVTQKEFRVVQLLTYGFVAAVVGAVVYAWMTNILK